MNVETKMRNLLAASRQVITDCILPNGAIVAANTDMDYASCGTNDYRFVWPRDAAFMIVAGQFIGLDLAEGFCKWLTTRAENFHEFGLRDRRYATNGPYSSPVSEYQPDQSGTLLWALVHTRSRRQHVVTLAIEIIADTLCQSWDQSRFKLATYDLWEQFPSNESDGSFVYSLAACCTGLRAAYRLAHTGHELWLHIAGEMEQQLADNSSRPFGRQTRHADDRIDASLLGLVWPFRAVENTPKLRNTVQAISDNLWAGSGMLRFEHDIYDGIVEHSKDAMGGAGPWPVLTCWYAIALQELGDLSRAKQIFEALSLNLPERWIPEQVLPNNRQGVQPLGWSHAMYVIAYYRLGYQNL